MTSTARGPSVMAASFSVLLLLLGASLAAAQSGRYYGTQVINLGVLMPYPEGDSVIPQRLANEWITALRVAMEVLNTRYAPHFTVHPFVLNTRCEAGTASAAAASLMGYKVVGVVGPACSVAAKDAAEVLGQHGVPMVSFAATADSLINNRHPTFFRTVYGDRYQAAAMAEVIKQFEFKYVTVYYSNEVYGQGISAALLRALRPDNSQAFPVVRNYPVDPYAANFGQYFTEAKLLPSNETLVVFCTLPRVAEGLWRAALMLHLLNYPWWYFGSDGAVAFDLAGEGDRLSQLSEYLQGEIGMAPYSGIYSESGPFAPFLDYWKRNSFEEYPGLLTLPVSPHIERPRLYVPYLIDSIWAFFSVFNKTISLGLEVTKENVFALLSNQRAWGGLEGTTGYLAFDASGERFIYDGPGGSGPLYEFSNLLNITWVSKSTWRASNVSGFLIDEYEIFRPGNESAPDTTPEAKAPPFVAPPEASAPAALAADGDALTKELAAPAGSVSGDVPIPAFAPSFGENLDGADFAPAPGVAGELVPVAAKKSSGGLDGGDLFGIIFAVAIVGAAAAGGLYWYKKKQESAGMNFVRIL